MAGSIERWLVDIDKLLGMQVMTGDGRLWRITTIDPEQTPTMVSLRLQGTDQPAHGKSVIDGSRLVLPLWLVVGALDYGLLERI